MESTYHEASIHASKIFTNAYSTSFSLGIKSLHPDLHDSIYSIYGYVRLADEIVDSFHAHNQTELLHDFEADTFKAIADGISLNPILDSFQFVINGFGVDHELIRKFLESMKMDLNQKEYKKHDYDSYIYGSAEVVGLMCLKVFCEGDQTQYDGLKHYARQLGSAFQKINFLRDFNADVAELGRVYFPNVDLQSFNDTSKKEIETEIEEEFKQGLQGIKLLPVKARFGVYLAYIYYYKLFKKIQKLPASQILHHRTRIPNFNKYVLLIWSSIKYKLGWI